MYKLLDLFCGGGGCSKGYHDAGFEVTGVDINPHPNYPYEFIQGDALKIFNNKDFINKFDVVHASMPCQHYSKLKNLSRDTARWDETHVDLVAPVRELIKATGKPYIIENVEGAPLIDPIRLCGTQFEHLYTQRPRLFESNISLVEPDERPFRAKTGKLGSGPAEDGFITVAGIKPCRGMTETQTKLYYGFALGGIDWMSLEELTQAIPPVYTEFIGKQMIAYLDGKGREVQIDETEKMIEMICNAVMSKIKIA